MTLSHMLLLLAIWFGLAACQECVPLTTVTSEALQDVVSLGGVIKHQALWEQMAYSHAGGHRRMGSAAHNETLQHIVNTLEETEYYDVETQPYSTTVVAESNSSLVVDGTTYRTAALSGTDDGSFQGLPLVWTSSYGCNGTEDWPAEVKGAIGLVSRGPEDGPDCLFSTKSTIAAQAGALALMVYEYRDNGSPVMGNIEVSGIVDGPLVPTIGINKTDGERLAAAYRDRKYVYADFFVESIREVLYSYNIIATTTHGDADNVVVMGAHSDSVPEGPGINDNGSGSAALLEIATQLSDFDVVNKVRFAWWTGEELGLLGSTYYVDQLEKDELSRIRLYLNYYMIGSGNGILSAYDGDGDTFNRTGPPGSAEIEHLYQSYFSSIDVPLLASEFNGRSDYGPFLDAGVPCGGLFTGADELLTEEESELFHDGKGSVGKPHDMNYHQAGDTLANMMLWFVEVNARAMAHAAAVYAVSLEGFPKREEREKSVDGAWRGKARDVFGLGVAA